jgi:hypothetical protein
VLFFFTGLHAEYHTELDDLPTLKLPGVVAVTSLAERTLREVAAPPPIWAGGTGPGRSLIASANGMLRCFASTPPPMGAPSDAGTSTWAEGQRR